MKKYWDYAWLPGVVSGGLGVIYFLAFYFLGEPLFDEGGLYKFDFVLAFPFGGICLYYFKQMNNGELRFWQGFILSSTVLYLTFFITAVYLSVHLSFDIDFLESSKALKINDMLLAQEKLTVEDIVKQEEIDYQVQHLKGTSIGTLVTEKFILFSFFGFFYSILVSIIFRK